MNLKKSRPAAADEVSDDAGSGGSSTKLLVAGGAVVGLAGAGALAFVLLSGGGDVPEGPVAAPRSPASAAPTATDTASPTTSASIPTYAAKNARDPFKALVTQGSGGSGTTTAPSGPSAPSTKPTSAPVWTPPPSSAPAKPPKSSTSTKPTTPTSSPTTTKPTIPYDVSYVVLNKIVDASTIEIYADDKPYTLTVDGPADGPFTLKAVDQTAKTATIAYGDVLVTLPLRQVVILQQP